MIVNVAAPIRHRDNQPLVHPNGEVVSVRSILLAAIDAQLEDDPKRSPEDKLKNLLLSIRIFENDEVELKAAEIAMLQKRVAAIASDVVTGRIMQATEAPPAAET